ncbi:hypothetical protein Pd630_LPD02399 [Rhodococcus opacus PD630]|nr:hypothetical protein Pd630_LPD02399 [Rhodococcus opacus PD630]
MAELRGMRGVSIASVALTFGVFTRFELLPLNLARRPEVLVVELPG